MSKFVQQIRGRIGVVLASDFAQRNHFLFLLKIAK